MYRIVPIALQMCQLILIRFGLMLSYRLSLLFIRSLLGNIPKWHHDLIARRCRVFIIPKMIWMSSYEGSGSGLGLLTSSPAGFKDLPLTEERQRGVNARRLLSSLKLFTIAFDKGRDISCEGLNHEIG
jgi:hypothetical protein